MTVPTRNSLDRWEAHVAANTSSAYRVLLVDDHAMVRAVLREILELHSGLSVMGEAANGLEAISMAASGNPDVILMDINMPVMNGIAATKRIKQAQPAIIIIGLSVNNASCVVDLMKEAGADAFLAKELASEQLYDVISELAHA